MSYVIDLLENDGSAVVDSLPVPVVSVRGWSKRINAPGKLVFSLHSNSPSATDESLRMWRHVQFHRSGEPDWYGVIVGKRQIGDRIEVLCHGALRIFSKRFTGDETFTGQGSAEAFGLLSDANGDSATGITSGTGGVTATMDVSLNFVQMLRAFEEFGAATGGEFQIDKNPILDFVPSLGSDKSATVELIFQQDGSPGTNLSEIEIAEDGEPMATRVIGTSGALTSTYNHPDAGDYPLLVDRKVFSHANDQNTLDALTVAYGFQRGLPIPDFQAVPATATKKLNAITGEREISGIDYGDVSVGDLVLVTIITPNRNTSVVKRIAELAVDVDEQLNERLRFTLTEAGVFVTERYLDDTAFADIKRRIQEIEQEL